MQVLDDEKHADGRTPKHRAGAVYDLYAPDEEATRPVGEFNLARIVVRGAHVEHWLNGRKVAEYDVGSDDWKNRLAQSKFAKYPVFGLPGAGRVGLQDHGDRVWFRTIRIREIDPGEATRLGHQSSVSLRNADVRADQEPGTLGRGRSARRG